MTSDESTDRNIASLSTPRNGVNEVVPVDMAPNGILELASGDTGVNSETCTSTSSGEADEKDSGDASRELESVSARLTSKSPKAHI